MVQRLQKQRSDAAALETAWLWLWQQRGLRQWHGFGDSVAFGNSMVGLQQQRGGAAALATFVTLSEMETTSWGSGGSNSCRRIASGDSNLDSKPVTVEKEATINRRQQQ